MSVHQISQRLAFAQHQQAGGVVDLAVDQHDGADAGVADARARAAGPGRP